MLHSTTNASCHTNPYTKPKTTTKSDAFIKRRNWIQYIIEGLRDFLHVLSQDGRILYASDSCKTVTGYESNQLLGRLINDFIHPDDKIVFAKEFQDAVLHASSFRSTYRFRKSDNTWAILESQFRPFVKDKPSWTDIWQSSTHTEVDVMARPYVSRIGTLFDSILQHKIENERLTRRLAELKREVSESDMSSSWDGENLGDPLDLHHIFDQAPSQVQDAAMLRAQQFLSETPDTYPWGIVPWEVNEPLGELPLHSTTDCDSKNIHGAGSTLVGDLGIPISRNRTFRRATTRRARKGFKASEPCICTSCGITDSPEWRRGPKGPKTLCNACGCTFIYYWFRDSN